MQAIVFDRVGEPVEVLRLSERPKPTCGAGEAVVEVLARPLHPADMAFIRGRYRIQPQFPQPAGLEGMGVIREISVECSLEIGQRVAFRWPGSWADFIAVPVDRLIEVPAEIPDAAACQIALNLVTAWGLLDVAAVAKDGWLLLDAATSTVSNLVNATVGVNQVARLSVIQG